MTSRKRFLTLLAGFCLALVPAAQVQQASSKPELRIGAIPDQNP